jgi:DNA-binding IclR family transcriptional regulator
MPDADLPLSERKPGIDRVVDLLNALLELRAPTKVGVLAEMIGAPRSSLYSIVNRLVEAGWLESMDDDGTVYLGKTLFLYGNAYAEVNPLPRRARATLVRLARDFNVTTQLCAMRGNRYLLLDACDSSSLFRINSPIGVEVPLPWTASGRLLLNHLSPAEIRRLIPAQDYHLPNGNILPAKSFLEDVARSRLDGYSVTTGLADHIATCMAAPILNGDIAIATLCFIIPVDTEQSRKDELLKTLVREAKALST